MGPKDEKWLLKPCYSVVNLHANVNLIIIDIFSENITSTTKSLIWYMKISTKWDPLSSFTIISPLFMPPKCDHLWNNEVILQYICRDADLPVIVDRLMFVCCDSKTNKQTKIHIYTALFIHQIGSTLVPSVLMAVIPGSHQTRKRYLMAVLCQPLWIIDILINESGPSEALQHSLEDKRRILLEFCTRPFIVCLFV